MTRAGLSEHGTVMTWCMYMRRCRLRDPRLQSDLVPRLWRVHAPGTTAKSAHPLQPALTSVPDTKLLAELTVPYAQIYRYNQMGWVDHTDYRTYYSTIHWITGIDTGPDGKAWYIASG